MKNEIHQGKILEKYLKKNGYNISFFAKKLNISRGNFYNKFNAKKLSESFILSMTHATRQCLLPLILKGQIPLSGTFRSHETTIMKNYIKFLEKHIELLELSTKIFIEILRKKSVFLNPTEQNN